MGKEVFVQPDFENEPAFSIFRKDAEAIEHYLNQHQGEVKEQNKMGFDSKKIQKMVESLCKELGYETESKKEYGRPDFFKKLGPGKNGIMIEVERGKTLNNNMDLLDFWKCHTNRDTNCLILIVPEKVPRKTRPQAIAKSVLNRIGAMFKDGNYTNVKAVAIISY